MRYKIVSLFALIILITSTLYTSAQAQGGISVSISAPSSVQPNTPVTLTAEVTENGTPKSGVNVTFFVDGAPIGDCTTDALGKCQIGHSFSDSGEYTVSVSAEGSNDSTTIVVGGTNTPPPPPPTRTPTPLPQPTRTNTPLPPLTSTNTPAASEDKTTPSRTPFFFNPSRTPTATRTPLVLNIPSSTPTSDAFLATPRITTHTPVPTRTPRPTGPIFAFPTISLSGQENKQNEQSTLIDLSTLLTVILSLSLIIIIILIITNFRRFRRLLWRLFRF